MHTHVISNDNLQDLNIEINNEIKRLMSHSPEERNFTIVKDIKIISGKVGYHALIIYDDGRI